MAKKKKQIQEAQRAAWREERARRKTIRHNTAANQEKHRADWQPLAPNELGVVADQRIMPRDEATRRERLEALAAQPITAENAASVWAETAAASLHPLGIVVDVSRGLCRVVVDGELLVCDLRGVLIAEESGYSNVVAVGDRVLVDPLETGHGLVVDVLPRHSGLARADSGYGHLRQLLAANVDQVLVVAAWRRPHLWLQLIDEYLIGAARNNLTAVICINKLDLADDPADVAALVRPYAELGYRLILSSAVTGDGLADIRDVLRQQTTVLAGLSGVGKSTLLNTVAPGLQLRTNAVSDWSGDGRHTTTQATMLPLPFGGYVVDTPGIRDMGVGGLHPAELLAHYPDVAEFAPRCRFSDCRHDQEPGCAVRTAVERGGLAAWRLDNYLKLLQTLSA